jgi:hypothetical protein
MTDYPANPANPAITAIGTPGGPEQALAAHIIAEASKQGLKADVKINAIPTHIASNICEMLKRVQVTGLEAIAWAEAFQFMQQHAPQQGQPTGVPFNGLPVKK